MQSSKLDAPAVEEGEAQRKRAEIAQCQVDNYDQESEKANRQRNITILLNNIIRLTQILEQH